jgi:hypothetical protein
LLTHSDWQVPNQGQSGDNTTPLTLDDIHGQIGELCITYLCFSDFETQIIKQNLVAIGAGTDILQSAVYSQLPITSTLGKLALTFKSGRTETKISKRPVTFNMSALQPTNKFQHLHTLQDKYALLDYVVQNWTSHGATLTPYSLVWGKLMDLALDRKYLFDVRPWESDLYRLDDASNSEIP